MRAGAAAHSPGALATSRMRLGDFEIKSGRVFLRKTGNSARLDGALVREVAIWLVFQLALRISAARHLFRGNRPAIWFAPDRPHPRYIVRAAATRAGIRIARTQGKADAAFFFDDATRSAPMPPPHALNFNFRCTDISKSRVAEVFEAVFGYPLAIDPETWSGEAVEKSEENGAHDGRIVTCPRPPAPGKVYQRLIDTIGEDGCARDLRTQCIGGQVVIVWVKRRAAAARFLPPNLSAVSRPPRQIFSEAELGLIARFVRAMGADWCALDVLRDRDGRIYVVDVNKTDAGPIIALPLRQKLASTALLAEALLAMIGAAPVV